MTPKLEDLVMAHRYLYYVKATPVIHDIDYDTMNKKARSVLHKSSPVHKVGSDHAGDYSKRQIELAESL